MYPKTVGVRATSWIPLKFLFILLFYLCTEVLCGVIRLLKTKQTNIQQLTKQKQSKSPRGSKVTFENEP